MREWTRSARVESGRAAARVSGRRRPAGVVAVLVLTLAALIATGAPVASAGVAACTPTGFVRDTINLTARMINPPGTVSGTVDATGCNIGVYYGPGHTGTVSHADVFGANYFGIVNDGGTVGINHSSVHDIGETPLNGTQHGNAIYFAVDDPGAAGSITHNHVWNYQKNGITDTSAGHRVAINHNVVNGEGPVDYIAQNGIEVGFGATATVTHNTVTGNSYTGANGASSGGILVVGGACFSRPASVGVRINHNTLRGNDVGVFLANLDSNCVSVATPTKNVVSHNTIRNSAVNNTTGNGNGGYQAGVSVAGDLDSINHNGICGIGYKPVASPPPFLFRIDASIAIDPRVSHNHGC